jgi:hypothetical protein
MTQYKSEGNLSAPKLTYLLSFPKITGLHISVIGIVLAIFLAVIVLWGLSRVPATAASQSTSPQISVDSSIIALLERATVDIETDQNELLGHGVLIDPEKRLVITPGEVMRGQETVLVKFLASSSPSEDPSDSQGNGQIPKSGRFSGRFVYQEKMRGLALLQVDEIPMSAAGLRLSNATPTDAGTLFGLAGCTKSSPGTSDNPPLFAFGGSICRVLQPPHYCPTTCATTPWILQIDKPGASYLSGGPIVDDQGALIGIGSFAKDDDKGSPTRIIDVRAIQATLQTWSERQANLNK